MRTFTNSIRALPWLVLALLFPFSFFLFPCDLPAHEWTQWRGPTQNGVGYETDLPSKFSLDPKAADNNLLWQAPYGIRNTPLVMNGRVYLNNQSGDGISEQERVMCLNADDGKVIWEKKFNVWHSDIVSSRLGWTNLAGDPKTGNIYWHGTQGLFICFDKDGKILWEHSLTEEFGRISGYGGRLCTPIVDEELVIVGMMNFGWGDQAMTADRYLAMNKKTGSVVWWWQSPHGHHGTYASTPVVAVIKGQRELVINTSGGYIHGLKVRTGEPIWAHPVAKGALNTAPVVSGNLAYCSHENSNYDDPTRGGVYCFDAGQIDKGKPKLVWRKLGTDFTGGEFKYASPTLHGDELFVCTDIARMYCLDAKSGEPVWKKPLNYGRNANGSPVYADGKIYVSNVNGTFFIIDPKANTPKERILHEQEFMSVHGDAAVESNGSAAVANGRVYFGTSEAVYCIGKKGAGGQGLPIPPMPTESDDHKPVAVMVEPAEVVVHPGATVKLKVKVVDANGRPVPVKSFEGQWSLPEGPLPFSPKTVKTKPPALKAKLTGDGSGATLIVDADIPEQWGLVEFKSGLGTVKVRVRVVPKMPYKQDFKDIADGYVPGGWVGAQGKFFVVTTKDGKKMLRNNNKVPNSMVYETNAYFGEPHWTNYTIDAEVMGTKVEITTDAGKKVVNLPDMGIINNRYRLLFKGNNANLRIDAWDAIPRVAVDVPYVLKSGVWYRMKFKVEVDSKKNEAHLSGKVWEAKEKEPAGWTITFTDPNPNTEGCAGIFSSARLVLENQPGADVYYKSIAVTPNSKE